MAIYLGGSGRKKRVVLLREGQAADENHYIGELDLRKLQRYEFKNDAYECR